MPPICGLPTYEPAREPALDGANEAFEGAPPLGMFCGDGPLPGMYAGC